MERLRPASILVEQCAVAAMGAGITVEAVEEGRSTAVYRLLRGWEVYYLRILPEDGATFAPEVAAHTILHRQGVRVPEVVYWVDCDNVVGRSVMITTEIPGTAIGASGRGVGDAKVAGIMRAAGQDLAVLNRVPVEGFGWVGRDSDRADGLRADLPTERTFMLAALDHSLHVLTDAGLGARECQLIRDVTSDHVVLLDAGQAHLAHGDFDATHIYCAQGRYTGIIDLGEIRGTGPYYDLGHFRFHDGETLPFTVFSYLLEGYQEITALPPDGDRRIALASLVIGTDFLARTYARLAERKRRHALAAIGANLQLLSA
jgi:aminoglycoside phosphotransferase (APT) family kinase protein